MNRPRFSGAVLAAQPTLPSSATVDARTTFSATTFSGTVSAALALLVALAGCGGDPECDPGFVLCEGSCQPVASASCADGGSDAGSDSGSDATTIDAFVPLDAPVVDGSRDTPPPGSDRIVECQFYYCESDLSCPGRRDRCDVERTLALGGARDPIRNAPAGLASVEQVRNPEGMCTPVLSAPIGSDDACEVGSSCGGCAQCRAVGDLAMCLKRCSPNLEDNDVCRPGYECGLGEAACLPIGCQSDAECRITRVDDNGVPGIQTPSDCVHFRPNCGADGSTQDSLVYDTTSTATCNPRTFRCDRPGFDLSASAGDVCESDADCEFRGRCAQQRGRCTNAGVVHCSTEGECSAVRTGALVDGTCDVQWRDNACIKTGCQVAGNECANGGTCQTRGVDVAICLAPCTLGAGATSDPASWIDETTGAGGCRAGYRCAWNGERAYGEVNGGCVPANFSEITEPNLGERCTSDADCWGPFGQQRCLRSGDFPGFCAIMECEAPYLSAGASVCGEANPCVNFGSDSAPLTACLKGCNSAAECPGAEMGCVDTMTLFGLPSVAEGVCFPACLEDADCHDGASCIGASATALGRCE